LAMGWLAFLSWTATLLVIRPKRFFRIWLGVPTVAFVVLVCAAFAASVYRSLPGVVFQDSVGFAPPPDVTVLNSLRHMPTDWDDSYLELDASDKTIRRILEGGFSPIPPEEFIKDGTAPGWWKPPAGPSARVYATSNRLLIYDPGSGNPEKRRVYIRYRRP